MAGRGISVASKPFLSRELDGIAAAAADRRFAEGCVKRTPGSGGCLYSASPPSAPDGGQTMPPPPWAAFNAHAPGRETGSVSISGRPAAPPFPEKPV